MMKQIFILFSLLLSFCFSYAQSPKREMRSVWVATVWGLDWPGGNKISQTGNITQINAQKKMMTTMLDSLKSANINTLFFQVRSRCDAMYKSSFEPWSTDLVTTRGMDPGYDPLQFVIEECHKRGIGLHAWLNPYRFESTLNAWSGMQGDYAATNPEWIIRYPNLATPCSILDPGNPGVTKRITDIVSEIVTNYDVDGIVFDDYFYAYGGTPANYDQYSQNLYKPANMSVNDWRRSNVNGMIASVYNAIQAIKPYVTFGVSPFGIWTTDQSVALKEGVALPSGVSGGNMYAEIYCDPVAWLKQGTVDYISPQLYWPTYSTGQSYTRLCPWWSDLANRFNKHFYSSQSISDVSSSSYVAPIKIGQLRMSTGEVISAESLSMIEYTASQSIAPATKAVMATSQEEYGLQIDNNRSSDKNLAPGSVFYSAKYLYTKGFINYLKTKKFQKPSLTPSIHWKQAPTQGLVTNIRTEGNQLKWDYASSANVRFSVYAVPKSLSNKAGCFTNSTYLLGVAYSKEFDLTKYTSLLATSDFGVAVLDRYGNEFVPTLSGYLPSQHIPVQLIAPGDMTANLHPASFTWSGDNDVEYYLLQVAKDNQFTNLVCSREVNTNSFSTSNLSSLEQNIKYYWRVISRKSGCSEVISEVRSFTMGRFNMLSPAQTSTDVPLTPIIEWSKLVSDASYLLELSNDLSFTSLIYSNTFTTNTFVVPQKLLLPLTTYYVRVRTQINNTNVITDVLQFKTEATPVSGAPVIVNPKVDQQINTQSVTVSLLSDMPDHRVELTKDITFPPRAVTIKSTSSYLTEVTYTGLSDGVYYLRARGSSNVGTTAWSDIISFTLNTAVGLVDTKSSDFRAYIASNDNLIIKTNKPEEFSVGLFSLSGSQIKSLISKRLFGEVCIINLALPEIRPGIYMIRIQSGESAKVLKFIKD